MGTISVSLPSDGETIDAADYNTPINTIVNEFNGNIENANIKTGAAIATAKLATDAGIATGMIADSAVTPAKLAVIPFCRTSDATQSFTSGNAAAVSFDTEVTDTDTMFDSGTPTRITIKTAGIYQINGNLTWEANTTGRRGLFIHIDGAVVAGQESLPGGNYGYAQQVSCCRSLAVNSYIELVGSQTAGTIAGADSVLSVAYLGKAS